MRGGGGWGGGGGVGGRKCAEGGGIMEERCGFFSKTIPRTPMLQLMDCQRGASGFVASDVMTTLSLPPSSTCNANDNRCLMYVAHTSIGFSLFIYVTALSSILTANDC